MAQRIAYNAKVQRPGVCNAAETLLVHADVAADVLPGLMDKLREAGVELRVDARTRALAGARRRRAGRRDRRGLGHRVPRADDGGARWSTASRRRSTTSTATAPGTRRRS